MAFVVEDGTGLATATSLLAAVDATNYWADRGGHAGWTPATTAQREAALVKASDYIRNQRRYRWSGAKKTYAQTMPWPRASAVERDGQPVASTIVPWQVKEATAYLAARYLTEDLQPDLDRGGALLAETVGPLSTTYAEDAPLGTILQVVDGLLAPLTRGPLDPTSPDYSIPDIPAGYVAGEFEYP